jgi:hypothetical protein
MEQNPYLRANNFSVSQRISHTLESIKAHYHIHASQMDIVQSTKLSINHLQTLQCTTPLYVIKEKLTLLKA